MKWYTVDIEIHILACRSCAFVFMLTRRALYEEEIALQCPPNGLPLFLVQLLSKGLTLLTPQGKDVRVLVQEVIQIFWACSCDHGHLMYSMHSIHSTEMWWSYKHMHFQCN